jgi:glycosyltransferase involved in cell wall biosynthesis
VVSVVDIALVKADPITGSIRAAQILGSLRKKYSIIALRWSRDGIQKIPNNEERNSQAFNLRAPEYGVRTYSSIGFLLRLPIFWIWVFIKLCIHRPEIIHACNLDTVLPCYIYKVLFRKKLIFDILDRFAPPLVPNNRSFLFKKYCSFVSSIEETFAKNSEALLAVSDKIFLTFQKRPKKCITIMNCCIDRVPNLSKKETNRFRLLSTSNIRPARGLETLIELLKELKDMELLITGRMKDKALMKRIYEVPNIRYLGLVEQDKFIDLETSCDVMIALYDLDIQPIYIYGMANKILEAMMCGLPVITNIAHEFVNDIECGIVVEYGNTEQIKQAIITLRDNTSIRKRMGNNGRKAFLEKYNWTNMEKKLYKIYEELLDH